MSKTKYSLLNIKKFILIISFFISFSIQAKDPNNGKDILTRKSRRFVTDEFMGIFQANDRNNRNRHSGENKGPECERGHGCLRRTTSP